jgi:sugar phosphate isomerase/epimerase
MHVQGWDASAKKVAPVGQGSLDWKKIFTAAKTGGIQNYFVEMEPYSLMEASVPYLRSLQV